MGDDKTISPLNDRTIPIVQNSKKMFLAQEINKRRQNPLGIISDYYHDYN